MSLSYNAGNRLGESPVRRCKGIPGLVHLTPPDIRMSVPNKLCVVPGPELYVALQVRDKVDGDHS